MILIDVLPKTDKGKIILDPASEHQGEKSKGIVDVDWFEKHFPNV